MLPIHIEANYRRMTEEGLLSEKEHAFFTDKRLVKFWRKAEKYLSGLPADN